MELFIPTRMWDLRRCQWDYSFCLSCCSEAWNVRWYYKVCSGTRWVSKQPASQSVILIIICILWSCSLNRNQQMHKHMVEIHNSNKLIINYTLYVCNTRISVLSIPCMKMSLYSTHLIPISFYSVLLNFLCMFVNLICHCMITAILMYTTTITMI